MSNLEEITPHHFANILIEVINKAVFENSSDIRKIVEQLDSVIVGVDRIKGGFQQLLRHQLRNVESIHPIPVVPVEYMESEDEFDDDYDDNEITEFDSIEQDIREVGQRVDKVEEDVRQYEDLVQGVARDIGSHREAIAEFQAEINRVSQAAPVTVSTFSQEEVATLKRVSEKEKLSSDMYYRRTLLLRNFRISDDRREDSNYQKCLNMLRSCDLQFLLGNADNFFVSDNFIKLTFSTRRRAIINLLEAKHVVKNLSGCNVSLNAMVPPSELNKKCDLVQKMKQLKRERLCTSFSIFETKKAGHWSMMIRIFKCGIGSKVFNNVESAREFLMNQAVHEINYEE